jgi:hypothetical protein
MRFYVASGGDKALGCAATVAVVLGALRLDFFEPAQV